MDQPAPTEPAVRPWRGPTRRGVIGLLAGAASAGLLGGCGLLVSRASFRYRMRVEGAHLGTAVYEFLAAKGNGPRLPEGNAGSVGIRGEALTLATISGPVFVLLRPEREGESLPRYITRALTPDIPWNGFANLWVAVNRLSGAANGAVRGELPSDQWPLMVRFRDVNDPTTVEQVDPRAIGISRVVLATTTDPVTTGIVKRLPWLPQQHGSLVKLPSASDPTWSLGERITEMDFLGRV